MTDFPPISRKRIQFLLSDLEDLRHHADCSAYSAKPLLRNFRCGESKGLCDAIDLVRSMLDPE